MEVLSFFTEVETDRKQCGVDAIIRRFALLTDAVKYAEEAVLRPKNTGRARVCGLHPVTQKSSVLCYVNRVLA